MAVYPVSTTFTNTLDGTPLNWLLANVGDEVTIVHLLDVKEYQLNSTQNTWIVNNKDGYLGVYWITGGDFSQFNVGDLISFADYQTNFYNGTATILEKISNTEIRISANLGPGSGWAPNLTASTNVISKIKLVTAFYYKWNFIEQGEQTNYDSKIDGTEQVAMRGALNASSGGSYPMTLLGQNSYKIDSITIDEVSLTTVPVYTSRFRITHKTRITPIMLAAQWDDILNGVAPGYFLNQNCLRPVFYFEARYNLNDPNEIQTETIDTTLGNTGWFNENWNTGLTNYSVSALQYVDSTLAPIPSIALSAGLDTRFSFDIDNVTNAPFVAGQTKIELSFAKAPNDPVEYQGNGRDVRHNFVWDTATILVQSGSPSPVNGDFFGIPNLQSLTQLKAVFISASKIRVTGRINLYQQAIDVFNESAEPRYLFFISVQGRAVLGGLADRVTLLVDAGSVFFQTDFPNLVQFYDTLLLPHTNADYPDTIEPGDIFTEDELVGYSRFEIIEDPAHPTTTKVITSVRGKVIAIETVSPFREFILESTSLNVANAPVYNGSQVFNITQAKPIHVPSTEIRKNIRAYFDATLSRYFFAYPYLNRWEYWVALQSASQAFFNQAQPNNGLNHDWRHYSAGNWKLCYRTEVAMKVNGVPAIYKNQFVYNDRDRNLAAATSCTIDTFNANTLTPLTAGGVKYILGYDYTLVRATFTNVTTPFNPAFVTVVIGIEVFEQGGVNGKRRMSSKYASDSDTWFIPLPGETKTKLTITTTTVVAETYVDFNAIPLDKTKFKLTARLYGNDVLAGSPSLLDYSQNYLGDQVVGLIRNNPIPSIPQVLPLTEPTCESDDIWRVLADANSSDPLKNDRNSFLWWFDKDAVGTAVISLILPDGTSVVVTGNTSLGTPYDYGFYTNGQNEKLVGYLFNWKAVMAAYGECIYQVKCDATTVFGDSKTNYSEKYCLKQYTQARADRTVRVEYYINGILGLNDFDDRSRDLGTLNWYNQHRFDGIFTPVSSQYTVDEIQYENGEIQAVEDEQAPEYQLELKPMVFFKHEVMRTDILQADKTLVTDYNTKNVGNFYKKDVKKSTDYSPQWNIGKTKTAPVKIKFRQTFNNLRKFIS